MVHTYINQLQSEMMAHSDAKKAKNMSSYLQNRFDCLGVKSPIRNEIQKKWFADLKQADLDHWDIVYSLWELPEREYQYIAVDYANKIPKRALTIDDHKYLEELITTKSWWETVDMLSSNIVGRYFQQFPEQIDPVISKWRNSDNLWLNRTCLIFQLKYKDKVDFELLKSLIRQYQNVEEFFIQKAIGWSLRQYSKFNPEDVRSFITEIELSGLALREGSKYL